MTIRFTSFLLISTEIDASLKERSNLLQSNYVKLAGFPFRLWDQSHTEKRRYDPQEVFEGKTKGRSIKVLLY